MSNYSQDMKRYIQELDIYIETQEMNIYQNEEDNERLETEINIDKARIALNLKMNKLAKKGIDAATKRKERALKQIEETKLKD